MFGWITHTVLSFISRYGYLAVFVYMALETAFVLHFAPSELVVPVAATQLVHGPASFALFVLDATAGATVGSLLAYYLFGKNGEAVLDRYGGVLHVSDGDVERSQRWFRRWGESSVFWGRMLPLVRAVISIPAGLADMDLRKFVTYSASGAFVFNVLLTYLVYKGSGTTSPLGVVVAALSTELSEIATYVSVHTRVVAVGVGMLVTILGIVWLARDYIRENPVVAQFVALHFARAGGLFTAALFFIGAVVAPAHSFRAITNVWNDPLALTRIGLSPQAALLIVGIACFVVALAVFELGKRIPVARIQMLLQLEQFSMRV